MTTIDSHTLDPRAIPPDPDHWKLRPAIRARWVVVGLIAAVVLAVSAHRTEIDRGVALTAEGAAHAVGARDASDVSPGFKRFWQAAFPIVLAERTDVARLPDFNATDLSWGARLETEPVREYSVTAGGYVDRGTRTVLVEPLGYLKRVLLLMVRTVEIGIWGTVLAVAVGLPLGILGSRAFSPHPVVYSLARGICSLSRAIPELVAAMFFVLMYSFGPFPGVLALGIHSFGFLGKFFADDIENADPGPQEALRSTGASGLKVLRFAVLPQVLPQYLAYIQYILERNVRSASVLGVVAAGGIGMELKGRWDMSHFGHVSTILLVVFLTVIVLELFTQRVRKRVM